MTGGLRALLAMTLAVFAGAASAKDYSVYRVIDTKVLDLVAGPANTAALLSPDGSRLLHLDTSSVCLLAPAKDGTWNRLRCAEKAYKVWQGTPEDALWSPHGGQLLMPTFSAGLIFFSDTDIRLLDAGTMGIANLTDDHFDGSLLKGGAKANLDLAARWIDDDAIAFVRYSIVTGDSLSGTRPQLMKVKASGGEPVALATLPPGPSLSVYVLAVSGDGARIAYSYENNQAPDMAGLYLAEVATGAIRRIAAMTDIGGPPRGMAFSADGTFLLLLTPATTATGLEARTLELATGKVLRVDPRRTVIGVAWSPSGAGLAYVTGDRDNADDPAGLFLAAHPGASARRLLKGLFMPPVCCGNLPFAWATNDVMILGNVQNARAPLLVRLGE